MIPTAAVSAYLTRPLDSHLWMKRLRAQDIEKAILSLSPVPKFWKPLRKHQRVCFLIGVAYPKFCFFLDMGTGKSILSLALLRYWFQVRLLRRAIIFVTSDKAFMTWERQVRDFGIKLPVIALEGTSAQKWQQLEEFGDGLVLLPYPGALAMCCTSVKKKGKQRWVLDDKLVARLAAWAGGLVLDESTRVGNHQSLTYKLVKKLKARAKVRYALTGRPFGRDPTMLWPQYALIDDGETLGETLGLFREAFFMSRPNPYTRNPHIKEYTFDKTKKALLTKLMQHRSIAYSANECIDLPKVLPLTELVTLPEETRGYYRRLVEQLIEAKGNFREVKNVFLRMRQLSSGFIGLTDDETGEKVQIEFEQNPKLERLLDLVEELPDGRKGVIFYDFTYSGRWITARLKELGLQPIWLWSGTKNSRAELERFGSDENCTVAVINNRLGSMSLDGLQHVANYVFFYESPVGVIDREQAERRLVRDGQKRKVFQYDLLVGKTMDERIRLFHREGHELIKALVTDPAKVLGGTF